MDVSPNALAPRMMVLMCLPLVPLVLPVSWLKQKVRKIRGKARCAPHALRSVPRPITAPSPVGERESKWN